MKHRFEEERQKGITFSRAMEIYQDVDGSVAAHKTELAELMKENKDQSEINHLKAHIYAGRWSGKMPAQYPKFAIGQVKGEIDFPLFEKNRVGI